MTALSQGMSPGRRLVHRFGSHLAYLLNTGSDVVALNDGALMARLLKTLAGGQGVEINEDSEYLRYLVAWPHLYPSDVGPEQAAGEYFERVLNRPLRLARANHFHQGHYVLLELCQRGEDSRWKAADMGRHLMRPPLSGWRLAPTDFVDVEARLAAMRKTAMPAARLAHGPPYLMAGGGAAELPEQMSLWQAICAAPRRLRILDPQRFRRFESQVVDAVVEANTRYGRLVGLGLAPTQWDDLATNSLKAISAFLSRVQALARTTGARSESLELWAEVWKDKPVPHFKTVEEFRASPIGRHLSLGGPADIAHPPYDPREGDEAPPRGALGSVSDADIDDLARKGVLDAYDAWFLRSLLAGKPMEKLKNSLRTVMRFNAREIPRSYIGELAARIRAALEREP